jgi:predicted metal-dependent peptidase
MASTSCRERLEKARIQFLFDHPFLSVLALSLPTQYRKNPHEVFETDGLSLFIDEEKAAAYDEGTLKFQYAHILLHILLKHPFRMKDRDPKVWNRSCDIVINLLLDDFERVGERPEDEVMLEKFRDQSVEEVYHALYRESSEGEGKQDENPNRQKMDLVENEGDVEAAEEELDALIVQAMGAAKKQGNIPAAFEEMINEVIRPKIDLQTLLHAYMSESFFDKTSDFSRPNRRYIHQGLYLPGYARERNRLNLTIALDRSMSISKEVFSKFLGIIDAILRMSSDFCVTVVPFDEKVHEELIVTYDAQSARPEIAFSKGNGGTDFESVVRYLKSDPEFDQNRFLIVLSDGFFTIKSMVEQPTVFLISDKKNMKRFERYGDVVEFDL